MYVLRCLLTVIGMYAQCAASIVPLSTTNAKKAVIQIILGSTRQERSSEKIARALKEKAQLKPDVLIELIDLRDYNLPFFKESTAPASQKEITDPQIKNWSNKIKEADAFIFIVPEYNAGYPGVLKNALDSLFKEWNNKPVGFVGYSGGPSGGASAIQQLHTVAQALKMVPLSCNVLIPYAGKAWDAHFNFADKTIEKQFDTMIDQLLTHVRISQ